MSHQRLNHSFGSVPFSWENQPGMSKVSPHMNNSPTKLPPPPPPPPPIPSHGPKLSAHGLYVPLPPCTFQAPKTTLPTRKGDPMKEDPFLAAYIECTKSVRKPLDKVTVNYKERIRRENMWSRFRKLGLGLGLGLSLSCKRDCGVREDSLVRMSQLPAVDSSRDFDEKNERIRF